ncbi:MAG: DUF5791 family protein [Halobacteriales archaeon]|nr:DUF5791 family protein [Halobacteriales archaeon]
MLADDISSPADRSPEDLLRDYTDAVRAAATSAGREAVLSATALDGDTVEALIDGEEVDLSLPDAAAILTLEDETDADQLLESVRDRLLFDMSTAILDVEALAGDLALDLNPQEIQRRVEGREPMTLEEYAHIRLRIARGLR